MNDNLTYWTSVALQIEGVVDLHLINTTATYKPYTEWVYYDQKGENSISTDETERCRLDGMGPYQIPNGDFICFVQDKINGPFKGIMEYAFSSDWTQVEFKAPFKGFLNNVTDTPLIQIGSKINIVFLLEVSGEYSQPSGAWATDGSWPIRGYVVESTSSDQLLKWQLALIIVGCIVGSATITLVVTVLLFRRYSKGYQAVK